MAAWQVLALEPVIEGRSQMATVRLQRSDQTVSVRCKDLGERWEGGAGGRQEAGGRERKEAKKEGKREKGPKRDREDRGAPDKAKVGIRCICVWCTGDATCAWAPGDTSPYSGRDARAWAASHWVLRWDLIQRQISTAMNRAARALALPPSGCSLYSSTVWRRSRSAPPTALRRLPSPTRRPG